MTNPNAKSASMAIVCTPTAASVMRAGQEKIVTPVSLEKAANMDPVMCPIHVSVKVHGGDFCAMSLFALVRVSMANAWR